MFCSNCGDKIKQGNSFCQRCGTPAAGYQADGHGPAKNPEDPKRPRGGGRNHRILIGVIVAVVVLLTAALVTALALLPEKNNAEITGGAEAELEGEVLGVLTGKITTASAPAQAFSGVVQASGGTISVNQPGTPIDGMQIDVPSGAYAGATEFTISYAPISSSTFGDDFDPISPLIVIENGGGQAADILSVRVPVKTSEEDFAMAFLYDEETGEIEGLPTIEYAPDHLTYATTHFSPVIVYRINRRTLMERIAGGINIGFRPGKDDWQFPNKGSIIAPDGHCSGQSLTSMWYFDQKTRAGSDALYGLYDNNGGEKTPAFWFDDSCGYRLASVIQKDMHWDAMSEKVDARLAKGARYNFLAVGYTLLTGKPQFVNVRGSGGSHAVVAYRIKGEQFFISDPNFPGDRGRFIQIAGDSFLPYRGSYTYENCVYIGRWSILADNIGDRWREFENKTIGNDLFPGYVLEAQEGPDGEWVELTNGLDFSLNKLKIRARPTAGGDPFGVAVYKNSIRLRKDGSGFYPLTTGSNRLGILISGKAGGKNKYIDFKYVEVTLSESHELHTERNYYDTGELWTEWTYYIKPDGTKVEHGYKISYYRNGIIEQKLHMVDGLEDGVQEMYWDNGNIRWRYEMKKGIMDGYSRDYNWDGQMYREQLYKDGVLVSESGG